MCVALSLTIVAKKMAKRHVLVKNLATVETLGCMSVLCSDKTGTLTVGKMVNPTPSIRSVDANVPDSLCRTSHLSIARIELTTSCSWSPSPRFLPPFRRFT